jgi:hypothetical protein
MTSDTNSTQASVNESLVISDEYLFPLLVPLLGGVVSGGAAAGTRMAIGNSGALWSSGERPNDVVSFYKDANFNGSRRDFPIHAHHIQDSISKGTLGFVNKENDTYSSVIVPEGASVIAYWDAGRKGKVTHFPPGRYASLGEWNDKISSFEIIPEAKGCTERQRDPNYNYGLRIYDGSKWHCGSWQDTGCTWGHTNRERLQCKKRK